MDWFGNYEEGEAKWEIILASYHYENHECSVMSKVGRMSINPYRFKSWCYKLNKMNWD